MTECYSLLKCIDALQYCITFMFLRVVVCTQLFTGAVEFHEQHIYTRNYFPDDSLQCRSGIGNEPGPERRI